MKTYILITLITLSMSVQMMSFAQTDTTTVPEVVAPVPKDTIWRRGGTTGINFSNVNLNNWSGGGQDAMSFTSLFLGTLDYKKKRMEWHNILDVAYGFQRLGGKSAPFRKSDDRIYYQTRLSYDHSSKLRYTTLADFRSQFTEGYKYYPENPDSSTLLSNFLAPAYITFSLGLEYLPVKNMSLFLSPASVKMTLMEDAYLSSIGAFGVPVGKRLRTEFGASFVGRYKVDIGKTVSVATLLSLFNNYKNINVDVFWDVILYMKISKYLTTTFTTSLVYDDDINVIRNNGTVGPAVQFKDVLAVGLVYKLNGYTVK
ncbi:MAG: DUF3078 domain-containing protein [Cytophagales bacterium]|nr:DUF3078 domain-containing protein [Cytophaga sp.]